MDYLATFPNTRSVLQAEQILTRRRVPFETVPYVRFNKERCGLAILFADEYLERVRRAFDEVKLKSDFVAVEDAVPSKI